MNIQEDLNRFLTILGPFEKRLESNKTDFSIYQELFKNPGFKLFNDRTYQAVTVYNFVDQKYDFMSDSLRILFGYDPEVFTEKDGIVNVMEALSPESAKIMVEDLTPQLFEYCQKYPEDFSKLRFTACLTLNSPSKGKIWALIHNYILCVTQDNLPILSCSIITDVTSIKKDNLFYNSVHLGNTLLVHNQVGQQPDSLNLSKRELEVIELIRQGMTSQQIADKLFVSAETIKKHRSNILTKTNCSNTAELINVLSTMGIV